VSTPLWVALLVACVLIAASAGAVGRHRRGNSSARDGLTPTEWLLWGVVGAALLVGVLIALL